MGCIAILFETTKRLVIIGSIITALGCVPTKEGPGVIGDQKARAGSHHLYKCHQNLKAKPSKYHEKCNKQLLIVGRASAFREFNEAEYSKFYRKYFAI